MSSEKLSEMVMDRQNISTPKQEFENKVIHYIEWCIENDIKNGRTQDNFFIADRKQMSEMIAGLKLQGIRVFAGGGNFFRVKFSVTYGTNIAFIEQDRPLANRRFVIYDREQAKYIRSIKNGWHCKMVQ